MSFKSAHGGAYAGLNAEYLVADRTLSLSTALSYTLLAFIGVYTFVHYLDIFPTLPLSQLAWNALVYATPPSIVIALEGWRRPNSSNSTTNQTYAETRTFAAKSEAMRRMLGLSGEGILYSVQRSRRMSSFNGIFKHGDPDSLPGLGNWDNSCYQNSILQGLAALPSLHAFLDHTAQTIPGSDTRPTNMALKGLMEDLNNPKNLGRKMWTPAVLKSMSSWQQQDAQEYYSKVVDALEKELGKGLLALPKMKGLETGCEDPGLKEKGNGAGEASVALRNPLEGMLAQRVGCLRCGYVDGLSLIPFNCLTVPLGNRSAYDITACLDEYTGLEPISEVECPRCTLLRQKEILEKLVALASVLPDGTTGTKLTGSSLPPVSTPEETPVLPTAHPGPNGPALDADRQNTDAEVHRLGDQNANIVSSSFQSIPNRLLAVNAALENDDYSDATLSKKCLIPSKQRVLSTKTRQAVIARAPKALIIHVNRSVFDESTGFLSKNYAAVHFPNFLDLSRWSLGVSKDDTETWISNPAQSILDGKHPERPPSETLLASTSLYALRAVITHQGRHENGHYIAYRRDPTPENNMQVVGHSWWRLSDENVTSTDQKSVLAQGGVFMLFYEQASDADKVAFLQTVTQELRETARCTEANQDVADGASGPGDSRGDPGISDSSLQAPANMGLSSLIPARTTSLSHHKPTPSKSASAKTSTPTSSDAPSTPSRNETATSSPATDRANSPVLVPSSKPTSPTLSTSPAIPPRKASKAKGKSSHTASSSPSIPHMRTSGHGDGNVSPQMDSRSRGMVSAK